MDSVRILTLVRPEIVDNFERRNVFRAPVELGDCLGASLSSTPTGRLLAIGAPRHRSKGRANVGRVLVLQSPSGRGDDFHLLHVIEADAFTPIKDRIFSHMYFGQALSLDPTGRFLAVSAHGAPDYEGAGFGRGAVLIFRIDADLPTLACVIGDGFIGEQTISLPLADDGFFGSSVAIDEERRICVVGAHHHSFGGDSPEGSGAVYVFRFSGNDFQKGRLAHTIGDGCSGIRDLNLSLSKYSYFGQSVALQPQHNVIAVGARSSSSIGGSSVACAGSIYTIALGPLRPDLRSLVDAERGEQFNVPFVEDTRLGMQLTFDHLTGNLLVSASGAARAKSDDAGLYIFPIVDGGIQPAINHVSPADLNRAVGSEVVKPFSWYLAPWTMGGEHWVAIGLDYDLRENTTIYKSDASEVVIVERSILDDPAQAEIAV